MLTNGRGNTDARYGQLDVILGLPTETREELDMTVRHVHELWDIADANPGSFRVSVFEFRPYPGMASTNRDRPL
ncbi:hypothetical protein GCM10027280_61350 [Micromonospora polyrhachis]